MATQRIVIFPDDWIKKYGGNVKVYGIDMKLGTLIFRNYQYLVFKAPGGMYWAGRGEQKYSPASFWVCEILESDPDLEAYHEPKAIEALKLERLFDFQLPRQRDGRKKQKETNETTPGQLQTSAFLPGED